MPSLRGRMIGWILKILSPKGKTFLKPIPQQRREMEAKMASMKPPKGVKIVQEHAGTLQGEWLTAPESREDRLILYIHGGGYYNGSLSTHRAHVGRMAEALAAKAFHFAYRLAPEHPFPAGVEDCLAVYEWLLRSFPQASILIAGESAGGNLVMATLLSIRNQGLPLPAAAVCLSPHVDFTFSSPSIHACADSEVMYTLGELEWMRGVYLGEEKAQDETLWRHPLVSPLWADLRGLPPLLIHVAGSEMLRDDARVLAEKARAAGVEVEFKLWEGLFHAFQLVPFLPETKIALKEIRAFADRHWGR